MRIYRVKYFIVGFLEIPVRLFLKKVCASSCLNKKYADKVIMKKIFYITILLLFSFTISALNIGYKNNSLAKKKLYSSDTGYISLNALSRQMGVEIDLDATLGKVDIYRERAKVKFIVDSKKIFFGKDGISDLRYKTKIVNGEFFVSLDAMRTIYRELSKPGESWFISQQKNEKTVNDDINDLKATYNKIKLKSTKIDVVFIDPGHGGRDPGAVGYRGLRESQVVLSIAKLVYSQLRGIPGVKVVMTRTKNRTLSLSQRAKIANKYFKQGKKCVFVSIHANASLAPSRYGYETYYLSPIASNADSRSTAVTANTVSNGGLSVKNSVMNNIFSKMAVEQYRRESLQLSELIQKQLTTQIGRYSKNRGVRKANFFVMRQMYMPSVLVETGFLTNSTEGRRLGTYSYKLKVAKGISVGIKKFIHLFNKNN